MNNAGKEMLPPLTSGVLCLSAPSTFFVPVRFLRTSASCSVKPLLSGLFGEGLRRLCSLASWPRHRNPGMKLQCRSSRVWASPPLLPSAGALEQRPGTTPSATVAAITVSSQEETTDSGTNGGANPGEAGGNGREGLDRKAAGAGESGGSTGGNGEEGQGVDLEEAWTGGK